MSRKDTVMAVKVVTARIDAKAKTVTLEGESGLKHKQTFAVQDGDTLKWNLEGVPTGSTARVRFVKFPKAPDTALLKKGKVVEGNGALIDGGVIAADAFDGPYSYEVDLLTPQGTTTLQCFWTDGAATLPVGMGGGDKSAGPQ
jgi:hypothetical protein